MKLQLYTEVLYFSRNEKETEADGSKEKRKQERKEGMKTAESGDEDGQASGYFDTSNHNTTSISCLAEKTHTNTPISGHK